MRVLRRTLKGVASLDTLSREEVMSLGVRPPRWSRTVHTAMWLLDGRRWVGEVQRLASLEMKAPVRLDDYLDLFARLGYVEEVCGKEMRFGGRGQRRL
jgi:hypothetical protein